MATTKHHPLRMDANIIPSQLRFLAMPPMSEIAAVKQSRVSAVASHSSHGSTLQRRRLMGGRGPRPLLPLRTIHLRMEHTVQDALPSAASSTPDSSHRWRLAAEPTAAPRRFQGNGGKVGHQTRAVCRTTLFSDDSRQIMLIESTGG